MFDVAEGIAKGKALDIAQSSPVNGFGVNLIGTNKYEDTKNSDVIIITAGVPRKPGMTRDDLLGINLKIIKEVAKGIKKTSPNAFVICITNPLDVLFGLQKYSVTKEQNRWDGWYIGPQGLYIFLTGIKNTSNKDQIICTGGHGTQW